MNRFYLNAGADFPYILVENQADPGVKKIAAAVAGDVQLVLGKRPQITDRILTNNRPVLIFATLGKSPLVDQLEKEREGLGQIRGKREVFAIRIKENPWKGVPQAVVICGSDKRGTIYGMFTFSEYIGVPPLVYWGDAEPEKKDRVEICGDLVQTSEEPSVRYRGFFINDEWPCFGTWASRHFGSFTTAAYEHVFELLLRLKGNYLWPAMWSSCFSKDGPGIANAELADLYGVVMGTSHHEPCMRAGEEFRQEKGEDTPYGTKWNFAENEQGLINFWRDGLLRNKDYENIITIGMRGECDSTLLGEESGLQENIEQLKRIITRQREMVRECIPGAEPPLLLVVYKEVEKYYHGSRQVPGLKNWEGLDGVTLMLCEDNFGYLRSLPEEPYRNHPGGWGMYYHVDYHGAPISYEWIDSTPLSQIWEQMSTAYEYGIRDVWIVNAGDIKFHELSLSFFMDLAYRYKPWTDTAAYEPGDFLQRWTALHFSPVEETIKRQIAGVAEEYISLNGMRRPESLQAGIYHPAHELESDRMLKLADEIYKENENIHTALEGKAKDAYYSMIYYPAKAGINLLRMQLYVGKNTHYALQAKPVANRFGKLVEQCIEEDRKLAKEFGDWKQGKWNGMEMEQHIGFTRWNEDGCHYPLHTVVTPLDKSCMGVSRADDAHVAVRAYGNPEIIVIDDFLYGYSEGMQEVWIEIANLGIGRIHYKIETEEGVQVPWLQVDSEEGEVSEQVRVCLICDRSKIPVGRQAVRLLVRDSETTVVLAVSAKAVPDFLPGTFLEQDGLIVMEADHYSQKKDVPGGRFACLKHHGRSRHGMRVYPVTASFSEEEQGPELTWQFYVEQPGNCYMEVWMTPCNPVEPGMRIRYGVRLDGEMEGIRYSVPEHYEAGETKDSCWTQGVLNQIRKNQAAISLAAGFHEVTVRAMDPGFVPERIIIRRADRPWKPSYLGPAETPRVINDKKDKR